jgi:SET domain-containing protein
MFEHHEERPKLPHYGVYARLRPSKIHGIGVFAIRTIDKGVFIFTGDENPIVWINKADLGNLPLEIEKLYQDFAVIKNNDTLYGCPKNFNVLTVGWYLNHSEDPNVGCKIEEDYEFYALRDIKPDEELTVDYRTFSELP